MRAKFSRIAATGSYLPKSILTNVELASTVNTSDDWIRSMTGIVQRHIAGDAESTTEMAAAAASEALARANIVADALDLLIVATITPDLIFPSTAAMLQARIGARNVGAFDISAACSGFLYALAIADGMICSGKCKTALVVGSERMSRLLDWSDRSTCVLFGDGAAAAILVASDTPGIHSVHLHADGSNPDVLRAPSKKNPYLHMDGGTVFKFAVRGLVEGGTEALHANKAPIETINWVVPHQANLRIIEAATRKLGVPKRKVVTTVQRHANTSAASIPLALDSLVQANCVKTGDNLLLLSVGGGFTWASCYLTWA